MAFNIRQVTFREHGVEYAGWLLDGRVDGKRIRIRCKTEAEAVLKKTEQETAAINAERAVRFQATRLTTVQLNEAEAAFDRLGEKYTLSQVVDYFFKHHYAPDFAITISDASTRFQTAMEGQVRPRSLDQLASTLRKFEKHTENLNVHEITTETVEAYLSSLRARDGVNKATQKTWNNERAFLHQFFAWCHARPQRFVEVNPVTDAKRFTIEQGHVDVLPVERCRELMTYVAGLDEGKWTPYFAIALFGGVRPAGELQKLAEAPQSVDLQNKVIRLSGAMSKTGKPRQIKIRPNLLKWLKRFPGPILPSKAKRDITAIRQKFKLSHDVLRHTFISCHVGAFKSFADAAIEAGNSETVIRTSYLNTSTFAAAKEFWKIEPE
jgi:Phage integrase, N-terminal SAM-like domain